MGRWFVRWWIDIHHCTMYGVTDLVTEVTKLVTHERKFDDLCGGPGSRT